MFRILLFVSAFTLAAFPASGQTRIDLSSPDAVMADLRSLAERWTHDQFSEFLRAAVFASLPDYGADPLSFRQGPTRWSRYEEGVWTWIGFDMQIPLLLEGDPFIETFEPGVLERRLHKEMNRALEGRTIDELVELGRARERVVLTFMQEEERDRSRSLESEIEEARLVVARPGASIEDEHRLRNLETRLRRAERTLDFTGMRLRELETGGSFTPGASDCRLAEALDLTTEQTIMASLETLARTCPQRELIAFLRAATLLSEVPPGLVRPGARLHPGAFREAEGKVGVAMRPISMLAGFIQLSKGIPEATAREVEQFAGNLRRALTGRTASEVIREGEQVEIAFLALLRDRYGQLLRDEVEALGPNPEASALASRELKQLRAKIARIDDRLHGVLLDDTSAR